MSCSSVKDVDIAILAVRLDKRAADWNVTKGKYTAALMGYHRALEQAAAAFEWSQRFEVPREWFARELYPQLRRAVELMPEIEECLRRFEKEHLPSLDAVAKEYWRSDEKHLAYWRVRMNLPVTVADVKLSEEERGVEWWKRNSEVKSPALVRSRREAWLAIEERMRRLELYVKGKGPRPPHVHEIVKELRREGKIGPEPKLKERGSAWKNGEERGGAKGPPPPSSGVAGTSPGKSEPRASRPPAEDR